MSNATALTLETAKAFKIELMKADILWVQKCYLIEYDRKSNLVEAALELQIDLSEMLRQKLGRPMVGDYKDAKKNVRMDKLEKRYTERVAIKMLETLMTSKQD